MERLLLPKTRLQDADGKASRKPTFLLPMRWMRAQRKHRSHSQYWNVSFPEASQGLEFPACHSCNQNTKSAEDVASFVGRMYPDPTDPALLDEAVEKLKALHNDHPVLVHEIFNPSIQQLEEFRARSDDVPIGTHPLNANGPILNNFMDVFGTKIALALHYEATRQIVPKTGAVLTRWFSNYEAFSGMLPTFLNDFPTDKTLQQGTLNVADQFAYSTRLTKDRGASLHFVSFGQSFAIVAFVYIQGEVVPEEHRDRLRRPGYWN